MEPQAPTDLLRPPPFPGIAPQVAAIVAGHTGGAGGDRRRARDAARAMARTRVGGRFWGRQVTGRSRLIVLDETYALPAGPLDDSVVIAHDGRCRAATRRQALVVGGDVDPWCLIDVAQQVSAPRGHEIGVLALAAGRVVVDHAGVPWTDEDGAMFDRWLMTGRRYRDPIGGGAVEVEQAIALLASWREVIDANRGIAAATGIAFWKRRELERLLWSGAGPVRFRSAGAALRLAKREGGAVAAWPSRVPVWFGERAAALGVPIRWVEDGFLRSAGLGSDLTPPLSIIVDDLRPYFDSAGPSRLERLLQEHDFAPALESRAAALRATIVAGRVGKYRAGGADEALDLPTGKPLVLVIGQVEDDLSVLRGGGGIAGNLELLTQVRAAEPDAFIIYRPHPDVEAGHRRGAIPDTIALRLADRVMRNASLDALLARADRVHVLSSLTGFEALLRGRTVVAHGGPFFAGWGLTDDRGPPLPRRTRRVTLDQLVAGALILYPRYLDPVTGLPCGPEAFINGLKQGTSGESWLVRIRRWQGRLRRTVRR